MSEHIELNDEALQSVNGGLFVFNQAKMKLTYTHADGSVTIHTITDYNKAWYISNTLHAQNLPEDEILASMIKNNCIE